MVQWTLSRPLKLALPCLGVGIVFFLVAFSVHFWFNLAVSSYELDGGLWKACAQYKSNDITKCSGWSSDDLKRIQRDWFHKNQALQCLALIVLVGVVGSLVVFFLTRLKAAIVTAIITCFMAAFFMILGCALFASDMSSDTFYSTYGTLGWAFGFSIVGAIFITATGGALIVHVLFFTTTTTTTTTTNAPV